MHDTSNSRRISSLWIPSVTTPSFVFKFPLGLMIELLVFAVRLPGILPYFIGASHNLDSRDSFHRYSASTWKRSGIEPIPPNRPIIQMVSCVTGRGPMTALRAGCLLSPFDEMPVDPNGKGPILCHPESLLTDAL